LRVRSGWAYVGAQRSTVTASLAVAGGATTPDASAAMEATRRSGWAQVGSQPSHGGTAGAGTGTGSAFCW
jgi:hypothetical protein